MKGQSFLVLSIFVVVFSTVSEALAIGFEVDTPLDPFLGSLTKFKRHLVRRVKDLSSNGNFINASPADQLGMIFSQPLSMPPVFQGQPVQMTSQPPVTTQLPFTQFEQRKYGLGQVPLSVTQQLDAQLASFTNQIQNQINKRSSLYPNFFDPRQIPGLQQLSQPSNVPQRFA